MDRKITFIAFALMILSLQSFAQNNEVMPNEPGKCYAKCLILKEEPKRATQTKKIKADGTVEYRTAFPNRRGRDEGGFTEWKEVVCEKYVDLELINKLQSTLIALDYSEGLEEFYGKMHPALKAALVQFQKDNKLPIGQLTIETLKHLGI